MTRCKIGSFDVRVRAGIVWRDESDCSNRYFSGKEEHFCNSFRSDAIPLLLIIFFPFSYRKRRTAACTKRNFDVYGTYSVLYRNYTVAYGVSGNFLSRART